MEWKKRFRWKELNMPSYKYLIIGGGMTADAAVRGIRTIDQQGSIGMIGEESDPPYTRPLLSKGLWKGRPLENVWRRTPAEALTLHLGSKVISLNADDRQVVDQQGQTYLGEKLLLATGGTPRRLPFGGEDILYFRTLADFKRLQEISTRMERFAVIGAGFIGSEIAAALAMNGKHVSLLFPDDGIGAQVFPKDVSRFLNEYFRKKGVEVLAGESLTGLEKQPKEFVLKTKSGREILAQAVVAGIGLLPNIELAKMAGLSTGDGIIVDRYLLTSRPGIYAAGDVAEFYSPALGKRMRVEHEDNANTMGLQAGRNMAGATEPYLHLPFFYSDLFDLGYEAVGELDSDFTVVADWKEPYQTGVLYYLKEGRVRGVLLWNVWKKVAAARKLINDPGPFTPENIIGKLGF
jgi:3-phenylpropionate/trans-cinnamate dioxygenase ferredoxin reductase component